MTLAEMMAWGIRKDQLTRTSAVRAYDHAVRRRQRLHGSPETTLTESELANVRAALRAIRNPPPEVIEAMAKALFNFEEDLNRHTAELRAKGLVEAADLLGPRESWDDPKNAHCHEAYRGRALAAWQAGIGGWNERD